MIKKMHIEPGCVSCGSCEAICPQVFKLNRTATVIQDADLDQHAAFIQEAALLCPVQVIVIEEDK